MKFFTNSGEIAIVKANQVATQWCYSVSLEIQRQKKEGSHDNSRPPNSSEVMMVELDMRKVEERRPEPDEELEEVQIRKEPGQTTRINKELPTLLKWDLITFLRSNEDLFASTAADMPGIDSEFMSHLLLVFPGAWLVAQKRRKLTQTEPSWYRSRSKVS